MSISSENIITEGVVLASATTIAVRAPLHKVTGTTAIQTITPPFAQFAGQVVLIPADASTFTIGTSGNVANAVTATQFRAIILQYVPSLQKWCSVTAS